jgi:hypothetical protein
MNEILKNYFYKVKRGHISVFCNNFFSPNLKEKPLSAYTEYALDDHSFLNIGPIKNFFYKTFIFMSN